MDFLLCQICRQNYDKDGHEPHVAPCSHEFCHACVKALIKNGSFKCPQCRKNHEINTPEDFLLNRGLLEAIAAFHSMNLSYQSQKTLEANDKDCKLHQREISHRCTQCNIWACTDCTEGHTTLAGCSLIKLSVAVDNIKKEHNTNVDQLLKMFEGDINYITSVIEVHNDKIKDINEQRKKLLEEADRHGEEIKKIQNLVIQGNIRKADLVKSKNDFNSACTPYELMEKAEVLIQNRQLLHSWSLINLGTGTAFGLQKRIKEIKEGNELNIDLVIKDEKKEAKLSYQDGQILIHTFVPHSEREACKTIFYERVQELLPLDSQKVFLELSVQGTGVLGKIIIRLEENIPNIKENFVKLVTGMNGKTLRGITLPHYKNNMIYHDNTLPFEDLKFTKDLNARSAAEQGEVYGTYDSGFLSYLYFNLGTDPYTYSSTSAVIGRIVDNISILQIFVKNQTKGVIISDCGIIIDNQ